ncbi:hypothetical protein Q7P37_011496 [Cladosporium fusiforme]
MTAYANLPSAKTLDIRPFKAHVDQSKLDQLKQILSLSPIAPVTFENTNAGRRFGIERKWLENAKEVWQNDFDWRKHEDRINSFPNFKTTVEDHQGNTVDVQFLALFSEKPDAVPVAFFHGWPGSICEFLDILELLRKRYSPADLPYHVIVPSLPGYAYSSGPPEDDDYGIDLAAEAMSRLMTGLGFGSGYLAHGGDLGSFISRYLAVNDNACKGMHVTMSAMPPAEDVQDTDIETEKMVLRKAAEFLDTGNAFNLEQGTRTSTIGFVLSASPLALLSWIGEKILEWTDRDPPLEKILESVTLYWLTDTMTRCLYHSRELGNGADKPKIARISAFTTKQLHCPYIEKPCGYSLFAHEIVPVPKRWAAMTCNLVSFNEHEHGGHFAAMEQPEELLEDIEDFVKKAWTS